MYELFFDLIIAAVIGLVPVLVVAAWKRGKLYAWHLLPVAIWCVVFYGSFIEPRSLVVKDYALDVSSYATQHADAAVPRTLLVAVISDLHMGTYRHAEWLAKVVATVNARHPDVVLIAGDLASNDIGIREFAPLAGLKPRYGTFAVLGNWDYRAGAVEVRKALGSQGVKLLVNRSVRLADDVAVRIVGLDDLEFGKTDWDKALSEVTPGEMPLILVHNPDVVMKAEVLGLPLVIAGHTHGGQIRLPFIGPVVRLPDQIGNRFDRGLLKYGPVNLFITPGVGESGPRARLLQPPEVSMLRLTY
ncbi:MAG: hypothetical protein RLZZ324_672 [Candidatus Parcubacteria bacterium]|jgi:predicted MPP superfamily phosphohydrolase